jgi:hypothetical protein
MFLYSSSLNYSIFKIFCQVKNFWEENEFLGDIIVIVLVSTPIESIDSTIFEYRLLSDFRSYPQKVTVFLFGGLKNCRLKFFRLIYVSQTFLN